MGERKSEGETTVENSVEPLNLMKHHFFISLQRGQISHFLCGLFWCFMFPTDDGSKVQQKIGFSPIIL